MTAIVGVFDGRHSYVAGDSRCTDCGGRYVVGDDSRKVFVAGGWILGFAGDSLRKNALEASLPELALERDVQGVVARLRTRMAERHCKVDEGAPFAALVGSDDGLWAVNPDLSWHQVELSRAYGCGSGAVAAEAAAWQALRMGADPAVAVRSGVEAAITFVSTCGGAVRVAMSHGDPALGLERE